MRIFHVFVAGCYAFWGYQYFWGEASIGLDFMIGALFVFAIIESLLRCIDVD